MILENNNIYKKWYYDEKEISSRYWEKYRKESHHAATLTGFMSGMAKWNTDIPKRDRINILNVLIEMYEPQVDSSELYSRLVSEWKEFKEDLEK